MSQLTREQQDLLESLVSERAPDLKRTLREADAHRADHRCSTYSRDAWFLSDVHHKLGIPLHPAFTPVLVSRLAEEMV